MKYLRRYILVISFCSVLIVFKIFDIKVNVKVPKGNHDEISVTLGVELNATDEKNPHPNSKLKKQLVIRWFDSYHNGHGLRMKSKTVHMHRCKFSNCKLRRPVIVSNHDQSQYGHIHADAVVFQASHLGEVLPPIRRDSNQVFVFAERETWWYNGPLERMLNTAINKTQKHQKGRTNAFNVPDVFKNPYKYMNTYRFRDIFNWTMTYRRDSDIPLLYGSIYPKTKHEQKIILNKNYGAIYNRKTKSVAWLVSDCHTKSLRELYVEKLRQYIDIDVYGACGTLKCPKGGERLMTDPNSCIGKIIKKYKFILSFENTFHTDYVTEKLFDWFSHDIVQVVYGMADYTKITPDGTVINAADFESPKHLAEFLTQVSNNEHLYTMYLRRKDKYYSVGHKEMQQNAYCKLCSMLNDIDAYRRTYTHIDSWWQVNDTSGYQKLLNQALGVYQNGFVRNLYIFAYIVFTMAIIIWVSC